MSGFPKAEIPMGAEDSDDEILNQEGELSDDGNASETDSDNGYEPGADAAPIGSPNRDDVSKRERARLRMQKKQKAKHLDDLRARQNSEAATGEANREQNRLKYLLAQTEIFAHFVPGMKDAEKTPSKKKGKGRLASKNEEAEDEELMHDLDEDSQVANTHRLTMQPTCITGTMREYQMQGLNWLIHLYDNGINGILADEMGLGKTLQTISLLGYLHEYRGISGPHMIIVPKSTLGNWMNEIKRWCPPLRALKFHGNQEDRAYLRDNELVAGNFDICVTSFEMVIKEKTAFKKFHWRYIVIDEAHRIKNENSMLSKVVRTLNTNFRLLITGTPLQNNLHELWALLNFLLPEVFHSAGQFDEWFGKGGEEGGDQAEVVAQLHKVLRPFLLRRLKADVEKGLPPKKETILKVGLSEMQKKYYAALLQKDIDVVNGGGERSRLLNIVMQLRKACNHPYLFQGAEPGPPYTTGEHLIENAGKMVLLDKLLKRLKEKGSRVLIFSQMTRLLDILEDYCLYRQYGYCRIDGNTSGDDREASIDAYNKPDSEKYIFLLSTRAGGLGINLATADIVILYDSDWNPQVDLQAMDRAHRIGQKKEVHVYRFCTEASVEEKVIEKAYKKLALDALVIQQGRLQENTKTVNKEDLLAMVRYGAEKVFNSTGSDITEEDIDSIIMKGEEATKELNDKMASFTDQALKFTLDGGLDAYQYRDPEEETGGPEGIDMKNIISANWIDPPKRERKRNYNEADYYRQAMRTGPAGPKSSGPRLPRMPQLLDFQFFKTAELEALFAKEMRYLQFKGAKKEDGEDEDEEEAPPNPDDPQPLDEEEEAEKERLLAEGFSNWNRRDFQAFTKAAERFGRTDLASMTAEIDGKTLEEVEAYSKVFWERYAEVADFDRLIKNIEKGEAKIQRHNEIMQSPSRCSGSATPRSRTLTA
mmetsp:Transcript_40665/g.129745  ORF Transcript_40665/g.129745 Transcript_40665/m.129745 type:complete len:932 (+) Transcript_40665:74-2869(+)